MCLIIQFLWESVTVCALLLGLLQTSTTLPSMYVVAFTESLKLVPRETFLWLVPIIHIVKEWQLFLKSSLLICGPSACCLEVGGLDIGCLLCLSVALGQFYALSKGACSKSSWKN